MRIHRFVSLTLAMFLLAGCAGKATVAFSTPMLPTPPIGVTRAPDPQTALRKFMEAWKVDDYASMYSLLTADSQKTISAEDFDKSYRNAMNSLTLKELDYGISKETKNPDNAQITFQVMYKTNLVGDLQREMIANLKLETGAWRIAWNDGLILPELAGGKHLAMNFDVPARGNIYDRNGAALVSQSDAMALGITPGQILPDQEGQLLGNLSILTGLYPGTIFGKYMNAGPDWYIPVGEASLKDFNQYYGVLRGLNGLQWTQYNTRLYANAVAPHAIGYISSIQKNEADQYLRLGYAPNARIGRIGIEKWAENSLAGKTGGALYVVDKDGAIVSPLGKSDPKPATSIYLTIDENLQFNAQKAIEGYRGAIVVLERDTGRVLAMASSPGYDPNFFDPNNFNNANGISGLVNDTDTPLVNRATQGKYPLGSVFKVITFSAALESGTYTPDTKRDCPYQFTELTDKIRYDWTWEHFQDELLTTGEGHTQPSGMLTLTGALMRSCNPWFWHIGKDLYDQGRVTAIADMARGFGLGAATGIGEIEEEAGTITNPPGEVEAVNQAIGQGDVQVTPLQVARMMAAIGNGGTLYRPQLVEKMVDADGVVTQVFKPDANARPLPVTKPTLDALQAAMLQVVRNPRGTAYIRFYNIKDIFIYGKTGTAESGNGNSHAWFAGYTDENRPDKPDIAIAVIAENAGEGSVIAALFGGARGRRPFPERPHECRGFAVGAGIETFVTAAEGFPPTAEARLLGKYPAVPNNQFNHSNTVLGNQIQRALVGITRADDRGLKRARFVVLRNSAMPAALVECGFLSNSQDEQKLATPSYRETVALGLAQGVLNYFALVNRAKQELGAPLIQRPTQIAAPIAPAPAPAPRAPTPMAARAWGPTSAPAPVKAMAVVPAPAAPMLPAPAPPVVAPVAMAAAPAATTPAPAPIPEPAAAKPFPAIVPRKLQAIAPPPSKLLNPNLVTRSK